MSDQKPKANTVGTTRRTTSCWVRSDIKELLFIKLTYFEFVPLLSKQILTKQKKGIYEKISRVFTVVGSRFEEK